MDKWVCRALATLTAVVVATSASAAPPRLRSEVEAASFPSRVLAAHNVARLEAGVAPLEWDSELGVAAARYAFQLAINNTFGHSESRARGGAGENSWMGTRGAFPVELMIESWLRESGQFRPGVFPIVSRTGNWRDVGHYSQIIWPTTQKVGCALATNALSDYLVCRYRPAGNVNGVAVRAPFRRLARSQKTNSRE